MSAMNEREHAPGPARDAKSGDTFEGGEAQPEAAEVESARLLANQARDELAAEGLSEDDVRRLADDYVAQDRGESLDGFVAWAREQRAG